MNLFRKSIFGYLSALWLFILGLTITSCDWTEIPNISENTVINQNLSIPLFNKTYPFKPFSIDDTCRVHGLKDNFFYKGFEYPALTLRVDAIYLPINLNFSKSNSYIVKELNLILEHRFPVNASFKIQLYDGTETYYSKDRLIDAEKIDTITLPVEEIARKKLTSINLLITTTIQSQNTSAPIQITDNNNIIVKVSARLKSEHNFKEISK